MEGLQLNGSAAADGTGIALTPDEPSQAGSFFYPGRCRVTRDFETTFDYTIGPGSGWFADGFAFVIHGDPRGLGALGGNGGGMGFLDMGSGVAIVRSVVVAWKTYDDHSVRVYENTDDASKGEFAPPDAEIDGLHPYNESHEARIAYSADSKELSVYLDGGEAPILTHTVDIAGVLGGDGT